MGSCFILWAAWGHRVPFPSQPYPKKSCQAWLTRHGGEETTMLVGRLLHGGSVSTVGLVIVLLAMAGALTGCPRDTKAPGPVTELTSAGGDGTIVLSWKNPVDSDFHHVVIVRKSDVPPTSVTDGTVAYQGNATTFQNTGLVNDVEYFYAVYAYDKSDNRSDATITSASPLVDTIGEQTKELEDDIVSLPDTLLAPAGKQALRDKLAAAGDKYEEGDPCGAAGELEGYLELAQNLRQGAAAAALEDLYNRGRMLRFNIILPMPAKADCPGADRVGKAAAAQPAEESAELLTAVAEFGEPKVLTVEAEGETYTQLVIPGMEDWSGAPGDPAVPILRRLVGVPIGAECRIDVSSVEAETIRMKLYPAQEEPMDAEDDPFATPPFVRNDDRYKTNAFYPAQHYKFSFVGEMRDMRLYLLELPAGQYNPVTEELRLFKDIRANITFEGSAGAFITENTAHAFDNQTPFVAELAINNISIIKDALKPNAWEILGQEFMILTPPDLKSAADTLASWKRKKGISTHVFTIMDGEGDGPDTNTAIDQLITDEYNQSQIRPSYVLLFGDANLIPCFYPAAQRDVGTTTIGSDWQYAVLGDPATDKVPDFAVGRIPVKTLEQAEAVVNKIIAYEKTPPDNADFYRNAAIAAQFECCRDDVTGAGYDSRTFIEVSEFARNVLRAANKDVDRIYKKTTYSTSIDSTPRRYYDGGLLPAEIGPGYAWDGDTNDIINAFNDGRFLYIHRDHGSPWGWITPAFYTTNLGSLTNGVLQPIVYSINCASGLWDNETAPGALGTSVTGTYMLEQLLLDPDGGAVGIIGDTRNSPSWANSALLRGMMDATWPSAIPNYGSNTRKRRLGDILNHGKLYMWTQIGAFEINNAKAEDQLRLWHVMGDPTLEIWTGNPHVRLLPNTLRADILREAINVSYTQDDAVITAFEVRPEGPPIPIARGTVKGGVASLPILAGSGGKYPIKYIANHENAKSVELEEEKEKN